MYRARPSAGTSFGSAAWSKWPVFGASLGGDKKLGDVSSTWSNLSWEVVVFVCAGRSF